LDGLPTTLIHNDFNPRNIAFRKAAPGPLLCAYDWEMARIGLPQHDLAELLCFVLDSTVSKSEVDMFLALHRSALGRASGVLIDREQWIAGFRLALVDLLINRFAMYTMVHRFRPQRFLPRVMRTWRRLYEMFGP
jgi:aminoglycoside phosphotransferase (APT) family kinase protein